MKICISRIDKIGDMILSLPVIKSIKIKNPQSKVHVLASDLNAKVLKNIKYIDKIILIKPNINSFIKEINQIRKIKYDYFINFSPTIKSYCLCFFSNSKKKAALIFLSRYKKKNLSKIFLAFLVKILCNYQYTVNRFDRLNNNQELHQTKMMFSLIKECNIKHDEDIVIDISLPPKKIIYTQKKLVVLHLSNKWINLFYSEDNLIELIFLIKKEKCSIALTTEKQNQKIFKKIYDNFKIISNTDFMNLKSIDNEILILDYLDYESWIKIINSSSIVITPECGCTHIAAACKVPVNIIYDPNNLPEAIHKEYGPWKSKYKKFVFGENNINQKLIKSL